MAESLCQQSDTHEQRSENRSQSRGGNAESEKRLVERDPMRFSPRDGENSYWRTSMQAVANNDLILTDLSSFKQLAGLQKDISHAGFYQQALSELVRGLHGKQTFTELGDRLVALVRHAHGVR